MTRKFLLDAAAREEHALRVPDYQVVTPTGRKLRRDLLPCHCLVCGGAMDVVRVEEGASEAVVTYGACGCGNTQRSICRF